MINVETFVLGLFETNCYLVYSPATKTGFLIDPGSFDERITTFIRKNGIRIKSILNTHGHADHTAGDGKFGYPVQIHKDDSDFLKDPVKNLSSFTGMNLSLPKASRLLNDGDIIEDGGIAMEVIHTPGHTPGSVSLKLGNKIFTGDTLFREGVGRTDFPASSDKALMESIKKRLLVFDDETQIFPGHGPSSTIGHERKNNPFLSG
ncbi:MAG: MBL fold metallo-hydrolase [Candidatus Omnitrophota bacterium]